MTAPVLSSTTPLTGEGGVIFSTGPYTNSQFAALLIKAYVANYEVRLPNFEPFVQENIPSITSYQNNGTVEGGTVDIPAQDTDGSNFESDLNEIINNHSDSTATGLFVNPNMNPYSVQLVSGVVDILSNQPEAYIVEIFTGPVEETDPTSGITREVTSIAYQNTSNGWVLTLSQNFDDYGPTEVPGQNEFTTDTED
jgi:hypothetical protein